jgi:hypothetical protein
MNARPDDLHRRAARSKKPHGKKPHVVRTIRVAPAARVRAAAREPAEGHGALDNPLWLTSIAMAVLFAVLAILIATG